MDFSRRCSGDPCLVVANQVGSRIDAQPLSLPTDEVAVLVGERRWGRTLACFIGVARLKLLLQHPGYGRPVGDQGRYDDDEQFLVVGDANESRTAQEVAVV